MNGSFIPLSRRFFEHTLWTEKRTFSRAEAWLDLMQTAAFAPHKKMILGHMEEVERGSLVASVRWLSDRWMWSNNKVCLFLDVLEQDGMISREKRRGTTVINLCKYEHYNKGQYTEATPKRQRGDSEATPGRQIEEGKEGKEKKGEAEAPPPPEIQDDDKPCRSYAPRKTVAVAYSKTKQGWSDNATIKWWNLREQQTWQDRVGIPIKNWKLNLENWQLDEHRNGTRPGGNSKRPLEYDPEPATHFSKLTPQEKAECAAFFKAEWGAKFTTLDQVHDAEIGNWKRIYRHEAAKAAKQAA